MSADIDFEKLLSLASDPKVGANADSFSGMLKEAEGVIKLVEKVVNVADRAGALPGIVRALGKKYEVDVESPLKTREDSRSIIPASEYHLQILGELNKIPADELKKQFEMAAKLIKEKNAKTKPDPGSPGNQKPNTEKN